MIAREIKVPMNLKQIAGERAAEFVQDGMTIGLGSGSTVYWALRRLGAMMEEGLRITGVPTSRKTEKLAAEFGIPLIDLTRNVTLDLTIDGADEIDPDLDLIKGGGGSLLREKLVAAASKSLIIIADESKLVTSLGDSPLPVEIVKCGWETTMGRIAETGARIGLRMDGDGAFVTDNGNYIVDCFYAGIDEPGGLHTRLKLITGVVETGLFVGMADIAIIAGEKGVEIRKRKNEL